MTSSRALWIEVVTAFAIGAIFDGWQMVTALAFLVFVTVFIDLAMVFQMAFDRDRILGEIERLERQRAEARAAFLDHVRGLYVDAAVRIGQAMTPFLQEMAKTWREAGNAIVVWVEQMDPLIRLAVDIEKRGFQAKAVGMPDGWFDAALERAKAESRRTPRSFEVAWDFWWGVVYEAACRHDLDSLERVYSLLPEVERDAWRGLEVAGVWMDEVPTTPVESEG